MDKGSWNVRETLEKIRNRQMSPTDGFQALRELQQTKETGELHYFQTVWEPAQGESDKTDLHTVRQVLLFDTVEPEVAQVEGLEVVRVQPGAAFRAVGQNVYEINPEQADDYKQLLATLLQQGFVPERVLHLWSRDAFSLEEESLHAQLQRGVYSLLFLSQALMGLQQKPHTSIVYGSVAGGNGHPLYAAMGGFARSLRLERPDFGITTLEVGTAAASSLLPLALQEPLTSDVSEVRYVDGVRMVRRLSVYQPETEQTAELPLKNGGVYVITGGAGGLGLLFAEYIARHVQAKIVLTGRSALDAGKQQVLQDLQQHGAEVVYEQMDVTKRSEVVQLVADVKARYGTLHGVMHSAGVLHDSFAIKKTPEQLAAVLAPKVFGASNLVAATQGEELDFLVLFSSIASVLGNIGQVDYAFGNRFMDNLAANMSTAQPGTRFLSLNWPLWEAGGMSIDEEQKAWLERTAGILPLGTAHGFRAFTDGLQTPLTSMLVVEGKLDTLRAYLGSLLQGGKSDHEQAVTEKAVVNEKAQEPLDSELGDEQQARLREKTEAYLKEQLSKQTKLSVSRIESNTSLESYGIDSVMIMGLTRELESAFGELSKTLFFEYQNLAELTDYFMTVHHTKLIEKFGEAPRTVKAVQKPVTNTKAQPTAQKPAAEAKSRFAQTKASNASRTAKGKGAGKQAPTERDDIAIIGVSGRYPLAANLDEFWQNFKDGRDCITEIPKDRWDLELEYDPTRKQAGMSHGKWGGFLDDIDKFDPLFFSISPKEANILDPQERLFLQTVWHTLEDGGYTRTRLAPKRVGVFVGVMYGQYQLYGAEETLRGNRIALNSSYASIANRVSYFFNFHGPSLAIDTMCSSSLTAIHLACESLYSGESDVAVAGGVNLSLHPNKYIALSQGNFLASDGRCRAFGEGGDGYVPSEGVGAVLLKPLNQAEADGDQIYAVIKASSINHGGKTNGYTVPNPLAQGNLIAETLKKAQINPRTISYLEAHGTGTSLGDPIEINGLLRAFREGTEDMQFCAIGSAKSNIGHLESAAGIAGLTKILLQFKHKQLVPSIHTDTLNPHINFAETPFHVQRNLTEWKRPVIVENGVAQEVPRRAGISAFGAGGSNAHIILEEYERQVPSVETPEQAPHLVVLSGKSESRVLEQVRLLAGYLGQASGQQARLADIAYTLQIGREAMDVRLALFVHSHAELLEKLHELLAGNQEVAGVWKGDLEQSSSQTLVLKQDSEDLEYIRSVVRNGNLEKIAGLWVYGAEIEWDLLYSESQPQRVSLPLYPFEKHRHWVPTTSGSTQSVTLAATHLQQSLHPLVDVNESTLDVEVFKKTLRADEFFIKDHIVSGQAILPGTGYLEMVRAAGERAANKPVQEIRDVLWVRPIIVEDAEEVYIAFYLASLGVEYEVYSEGAEERVLHSTGRLLYADEVEAVPADTTLDVVGIKARCSLSKRSHAELYDIFAKMGFAYGSAFQVTQEVFCGEREAIAKLALPAEREGDVAEMLLHPSLMDGALRATFGIGNSYAHNQFPNVPFSLERLQIAKPLPPVVYAYVTLSDANGSIHDAITKCEITLCDEQGVRLVQISGFTARQFTPQQADAERLLFFHPQWELTPLSAEQQAPQVAPRVEPVETILVLDDAQGTFQPSVDATKRYVIVQAGDRYEVVGDGQYRLNPSSREQMQRLLQDLHANDTAPSHILHLWSLRVPLAWDALQQEQVAGQVEAGLDTGLYSLVHLFQAVTNEWPGQRVRVLYTFEGGTKANAPLQAAVAGLANALTTVNHRFELVSFQVESSRIARDTLSALLLQELVAAQNGNGTEICYTGTERFVRRIQPLEASAFDAQAKTPLKQNGVYLVTGGAGGLGMVVARDLALRQQARLVLTGRSASDARIESKLQELRALGAADAVYVQADVAKWADVQRVVETMRAQFGAIHGIYHVAGLAAEKVLMEADRAAFAKILLPKVQGTIHLDLATQQDQLDVFVLFSSVSALIGDFGAGSYAYANAFLDRFATQREQMRAEGRRSGRTISINWPLWQGGGLELSEEDEAMYFTTSGMRILDAETGLSALDMAMQTKQPQLVIVSGAESKIRKLLKVQPEIVEEAEWEEEQVEAEQSTTIHSTDANDASFEAQLLSETIAYLKGKVSEAVELPVESINARTALERYGIDSIMIMELNKVLEPDFPSLPKTLFFEYKNLQDLAAYFVREQGDRMAELRGLTRQQTVAQATAKTKKAVAVTKTTPAPTRKSRFAQTQTRPLADSQGQQTNGKALKREDIAIIGVSGRYPMANNLDEFWENLKNGKDCITEIPSDRWDVDKYYDPQKGKLGKMYSKWGGFLDHVDRFDPLFFHISPRDAEMLDPQERLFLETAWQTVEDAGYARNSLSGKSVGVFVGAMYSHYQMFGDVEQEQELLPGSFFSSIANRVSYVMNLSGPSLTVDTACSSALEAIRLGCLNIWEGSCELAIAGGVNVTIHPHKYLFLCQSNFLSSDGRCRSFGAGGDGYVPGEGVGSVLLKPLKQAEADGDHIYAVIKGVAVNHGGKTNGYTVPNPNAHADLIVEALKQADIDARTISYIEAHGTGTPLGDPIEISGLSKAFGTFTQDKQFCSIGSVKSNIGHLESAAGISGVTKLLLQMKHKQLVPTLHAETINPNIHFAETPFYLQPGLTEWKRPVVVENGQEKELPRRAGISGFGAGGTNVHLVLEEYEAPPVTPETSAPQIVVLSAKNADRLKASARQLARVLKQTALPQQVQLTNEQANLSEEVTRDLLNIMSSVLKVDNGDIDSNENMVEYGCDAINISELISDINLRYNIELPSAAALQCSSLQALANYLLSEFHDACQKRLIQAPLVVATEPVRKSLRLVDISFTLQTGREAMGERLALVVSSVDELQQKLLAFCADERNLEGVYRSTVKAGLTDADLLLEGAEGEEFVRNLIGKQKLNKVAKLWTQGVEIDWQLFYRDASPRRLSLPTYPFAGESYWVNRGRQKGTAHTPSATQGQVAKLHPLVSRNTSTLQGMKWTTTFVGDEFFLAGRGSNKTEGAQLPAITLLEMMRAVGAIAGEHRVVQLLDVEWSETVACAAGRDIEIRLYASEDGVECEVSAPDTGGATNVLVSALLAFADPLDDVAREAAIDTDEVIRRTTMQTSGTDCVRRLRENGLPTAGGEQLLLECRYNEGETLSLLQIPQELQATRDEFVLHPLLLEGMLQTLIVLLPAGTGYALDSIGEVEILGAVPNRCQIYVELVEREDDLVLFDVEVIDEAGQVAVRVSDFALQMAPLAQTNKPDMLDMLRKLQTGEVKVSEVKQHMGVR